MLAFARRIAKVMKSLSLPRSVRRMEAFSSAALGKIRFFKVFLKKRKKV